jgi:hypothetical protein
MRTKIPDHMRLLVHRARKFCDLSLPKMATAVCCDWSHLQNFESFRYGLSAELEERVLRFLLAELGRRSPNVAQPPSCISLQRLRLALAVGLGTAMSDELDALLDALKTDEAINPAGGQRALRLEP